MEFVHYYKTEEKVGSGNFVFRRFSSKPLEDNSRFIQLVEGSLEEITAEDWGNITAIPSYLLVQFYFAAYESPIVLKKITMPDTVISIGNYSLSLESVTSYVFSANLRTIGIDVLRTVGENCVCDFSKARQIPELPLDENGYADAFKPDKITQIRVPASLYSAWKAAPGWVDYASKIISV